MSHSNSFSNQNYHYSQFQYNYDYSNYALVANQACNYFNSSHPQYSGQPSYCNSVVPLLDQPLVTSLEHSYNYLSTSSDTSIDQSQLILPKPKRKSEFKCQICDSDAFGFHYGAYTCEACKLFFLRYLKNKDKYKSNYQCESKSCLISSKTRKNCSECRFKKCLDLGMSRNRSCFGRHTLNSMKIRLPKQNEAYLLKNVLDEIKTRIETLNENMNQNLIEQNAYISGIQHLIKQFYKQSFEIIFKSDSYYDFYLDKFDIILFMFFVVLFDIKIPQIYLFLTYNLVIIRLKHSLQCFLDLLKKKQFTVQLKILTFMMVANKLFQQDAAEFFNQHELTELIGLELENLDQNEAFSSNFNNCLNKCQFLNWSNQIYSILFSFLSPNRLF